MSAHTPTPWEVEAPNSKTEEFEEWRHTNKYSVRGPCPQGSPCISFQICQLSSVNSNEAEDAAHIVKCVNAHDDLVKALKASVAILEKIDTLRHISPEFDALDNARAALAKAGA